MADQPDREAALQLIARMEAEIARLDAMDDEAGRITGVGIWQYHPVSGKVVWSAEIYRIYGLSPGEFGPSLEGFLAHVHPDDREKVVAADRLSRTRGDPASYEHRIVRSDGEVRYVYQRSQMVLRTEGGEPVLIGTTQDITERRQAEKEVAAQAATLKAMESELNFLSRQSAMGAVAAAMAHEINQPLTAISNYSAALRRLARRLGDDDPIASGLAELEASALRAGEIVRNMRAMAQRGQVTQERLRIGDLITTAIANVGLACDPVAIELDLRSDRPVRADRIQIEQVLVNLIRNACEAMEAAPEKVIIIATHDEGECVVTSVADIGPGVPPGLQLFESSASNKPSGMGIGLSICRALIEANHGRIWTEHPARGACFRFSLPAASAS